VKPRRSWPALAGALVLTLAAQREVAAQPARAADASQITFAATVSIAPTWFDPAETPG